MYTRGGTCDNKGFVKMTVSNPHPTDSRIISRGSWLGRGEFEFSNRAINTVESITQPLSELRVNSDTKETSQPDRVNQIWQDLGLDKSSVKRP